MASPTPGIVTVPAGTAAIYCGRFAPAAGGAPIPAGMAATMIQAGDSITAGDVWTPHRWHHGRMGAPFELVLNCGFNGQSHSGLLTQLTNNSWTAETAPGLVGAPNVGLGILRIGTNNARTNAAITDSDRNIYRSIVTLMLTKCSYVVLYLLPPVGGVTQAAVPNIAGWNAFLRTLPDEYPGQLWVVDDVADLADGSGNIVPAYYDTADEVHPGGAGQIRMMQTAAAAHDALFSLQTKVSPLDPAAAGNMLTNSAMAGAGGTLGAGWTGQVINGGLLNSYGSGVSGTAAVVPADAGDPIQIPWQRITPASLGAGAGTGAQLRMDCAPLTLTSTYPARIEHIFQARFNDLDGTKVHRLRFMVMAGGQILAGESWLKVNGLAGVTQTVTYRATRVRGSNSAGIVGTYTPLAYFILTSEAGGSGSMGSVDVRCPLAIIKS